MNRELANVEQTLPTAGILVKPVANAIRILRLLGSHGTPMRAADIARQLGLNPSTCFNILRTLVSEDVVEFDPHSKMYLAGLGLTSLVGQVASRGQRMQRAALLMQEFASLHRVTITLWKPIADDRIVLVTSESSPNDLHIDMPTGQRVPKLLGASGRLFAAQMKLGRAALRAAVGKVRWTNPPVFDDYLREVEEARTRGWAIDDGNYAPGVVAVAAPVLDARGQIACTVTAVLFKGLLTEPQTRALGEDLCRLARQLQDVFH